MDPNPFIPVTASPARVAFLFLPGLGSQEMQQDMVDNAEMILTSHLSRKQPSDQQPQQQEQEQEQDQEQEHEQQQAGTRSKVVFRGIAYAKLVHDDQLLSVKGMGTIESTFTFIPRRLVMTGLRYVTDPDFREAIWSWICRDIRDMALELEKNDGEDFGSHRGVPSVELIPIAFSMGSVIVLEFLTAARAWFERHGEAFQSSQLSYKEGEEEDPRRIMASSPWFQSTSSTSEPGERSLTQARLSVLGMEGLRLLSSIRLLLTLASPLNCIYPLLTCTVRIPASIRWFNFVYFTDVVSGPLIGQESAENVFVNPAWSLVNVWTDPWDETLRRLCAQSILAHSVTLLDNAMWAQVLERVSIHMHPSGSPWTTGILTPTEEDCTTKNGRTSETGPAAIVKRDSGVDLGDCARAIEQQHYQQQQQQQHDKARDASFDIPWGSSSVPARLILPSSFNPAKPMVAVVHLQGLSDSEMYEQEVELFERGLNYSADLVCQCSPSTSQQPDASEGGVSVIGVSIEYGAILEQGQQRVMDGIRTSLEQGLAAQRNEQFSESSFHECVRHFLMKLVPVALGCFGQPHVEEKIFADIDASLESLATVVQALRRGHTGIVELKASDAVPVIPVIMLGLTSGGMVASQYLSRLQRQQEHLVGKEEPLAVEKEGCRLYFRTLYTLGNPSAWITNWRTTRVPSLPWKSLFAPLAGHPNQDSSTTGWFNFHYRNDVCGRGDLCSLSTEKDANCFAKAIRKDMDVQDSSAFDKVMSLGANQDKLRKGRWFWGFHSLWDLVGARWVRRLIGGFTGEYLREERVWCSVAKAIIEAGEELQLKTTNASC